MPLDPYEQCLAFYRRWCADWHMTPNEIDETDLELLLDMEVLDSKIDAAFDEQRDKKKSPPKQQVFIDQIL